MTPSSDSLSGSTRLSGWPLAALLVVATLVVGTLHGRRLQFYCDDSYISYRYARNFAAGDGLVFNVWPAGQSGAYTEPVEGYTNFLWVVILGAGIAAGQPVETFSLVVGILLLAATLWGAARAVRPWAADSPTWQAVPAVILVTLGPIMLWSVSGLETILFAAVTLAAVLAYERSAGAPRGLVFAGVLYALSAMTRPDGVVLGAAAGLHLLLFRRGVGRQWIHRAAALAGGFFLVFLPFQLWRYSYYHDWLPNTFYVKAGAAISKSLGWTYFRQFVIDFWPFVALTAAGCVVATLVKPYREHRHRALHLGLILLLFSAYIIWAGGDYMALYRFFVPLLPFAAVLATLALHFLVQHSLARRQPRMALTSVLLLAALAGLGYANYQPTRQSCERELSAPSIQEVIAPQWRMRRNTEYWLAAGAAMRSLPRSWTIATTAAGAIPWASELPTLDQSGLCDRHTAKVAADQWLIDRPGHMKQATRAYLRERRPEIILWHPILRPAGSGFPSLAPTPDYVQRALPVAGLPEDDGELFLYLWMRSDLDAEGRAAGLIDTGETLNLSK